jgi:hypothetical protein
VKEDIEMSDNKKKILEMLADKKISAEEAYQLLNVIDSDKEARDSSPREESSAKNKPKFLRVSVIPDPDNENAGGVDRVNVRVPISLIRAGMKLTSLIPPEALDKMNGALKEKGISFDMRSIKTEDIEELIDALADLEVDVISAKGEKVKVFAE